MYSSSFIVGALLFSYTIQAAEPEFRNPPTNLTGEISECEIKPESEPKEGVPIHAITPHPGKKIFFAGGGWNFAHKQAELDEIKKMFAGTLELLQKQGKLNPDYIQLKKEQMGSAFDIAIRTESKKLKE